MPWLNKKINSESARNVARNMETFLSFREEARAQHSARQKCPHQYAQGRQSAARLFQKGERYAGFGNVGQDSSCPLGNNRQKLSGEQSGPFAEETPVEKRIGTLLWEWRTARGWSLEQLAQRAGVSKAALSRW